MRWFRLCTPGSKDASRTYASSRTSFARPLGMNRSRVSLWAGLGFIGRSGSVRLVSSSRAGSGGVLGLSPATCGLLATPDGPAPGPMEDLAPVCPCWHVPARPPVDGTAYVGGGQAGDWLKSQD